MDFLEPQNKLPKNLIDAFQPAIKLDEYALASDAAVMPVYDPRQRLHFRRSGLQGRIDSMQLVHVPLSALQQTNSMAMNRRMKSTKNNIRGRSGQMPFTFGGLDVQEEVSVATLHRDNNGLLDIAPGLSRCGNFKMDEIFHETNLNDENDEAVEEEDIEVSETELEDGLVESKFNTIDELLPSVSSFVRNVYLPNTNTKKERTWAHVVDVNQKIENFDQLVPNPARTWPFELDNFQKEAVYRLEQGDSVFIAAHTSAGKTVVAEYAMSLAAQHMTKCIYTSPIKALSNQKYRDFKEEYDVGILTGDVQLNQEAGTLIMTTEILRSMLYRGADVIRDVEFIIFDEVHYVNDSSRGVVWEEVIIMLPDHVKLVLLSATVPNTFEFANWVGRTKEKDVYVISTPKRPVPLKHHLWLKKQMVEVVDEGRELNADNYKRAQELLNPPKKEAPQGGARGGRGGARGGAQGGAQGGRGGAQGGRGGARGGARGGKAAGTQAMQRQMGAQKGRFNSSSAGKSDIESLVSHLNSKKLLPAVFFVFSRKMTEQYAEYIQSISLNTGKEQSQVHRFVVSAIQRLRKEDRELPQIQMLLSMLQRGIGVHHSGLLPIMKEVVEILFAKGLVKLLFATETFAMGLNLPTRTVVFTAVRKFDSKTMRYLTPGEYTQMAGRAGRRGLDTVGTVIIMNNNKEEVIPKGTLEQMLLGTPLKLSSQFRLTYNMILSLLRIEAVKVEDVIQQSFSENSNNIMRPQNQQKLLTIERESTRINEVIQKSFKSDVAPLIDAFKSYLHADRQYWNLNKSIYDFVMSMSKMSLLKRFIIYQVTGGEQRHTNHYILGLLYYTPDVGTDGKIKVVNLAYLNLPLLGILPNFFIAFRDNLSEITFQPIYDRQKQTSKIEIDNIQYIFSKRFKQKNSPLPTSNKKVIDEVINYFVNSQNMWEEYSFDWVKSMEVRINLRDRKAVANELEFAGQSLLPVLDPKSGHGLSNSKIVDLYSHVESLFNLEVKALKIQSSATGTNSALLPEYSQRIDLLRSANYIDEGMIVALKGRVACEISTGFELYVTELIMDNFLGTFQPEEIVALLSVFVFEGARGAEDPPTVTPKLDEGKERLLELVDYVHRLADEHHVTLTQEEADFAESNRFALMQVVFEWARGMTFNEITQLTTVQEGTIVRVINRLDEVCRSVMSAARLIGEVELYDKLAIAQELIKRDIVFCSSLYI